MFVRMLNRRNNNQTNRQQTSIPTSKTLSSAINNNSTTMMIIERKISLVTEGLQRYVENWLRIVLSSECCRILRARPIQIFILI